MKSKILGILIALFFAAGYVTLNYPVLGTLYNQIREGKVIDSYDHAVHTMNEQKRKKYWEDAWIFIGTKSCFYDPVLQGVEGDDT